MARRRKSKRTFEELLALLEREPPGEFRLPPDLAGLAYRFALYIPLLSADGKVLFSEERCSSLALLFGKRFGGYSSNTLTGEPPWVGAWLPSRAHKVVIDRHMLFVVYSVQSAAAELFFQYLKVVLQLPEVANQQVLAVELLPVKLLATPKPESLPDSLRFG